MEWYYAQNNQQQGPVSEVEFTGLITSGVVTDATLVWRAGMANWQPYREVKGGVVGLAAPAASPASSTTQLGPDQAACIECGGVFPRDAVVAFGAVSVCAACKPVYLQKVKEGVAPLAPMDPALRRYAGFWIRVGAKIIDGLLLSVVVIVPVLVVMFSMMGGMRGRNPFANPAEIWTLQIVMQLAIIAGAVAFNTFFIGRFGATPGKMAVGIKVIMADGSAPTYLRAFGRAWGEQLSGLVCDIGYIIAAFDDQKRGLHDHICNTRVVYK